MAWAESLKDFILLGGLCTLADFFFSEKKRQRQRETTVLKLPSGLGEGEAEGIEPGDTHSKESKHLNK